MSWLQGGNIETKLPAPQRSSVPDASSLNMENKGAPGLATMLWKCLFPLEISCLWLHNSGLTIENVMMAADTFALLSQDHLHFLWQQNLLETILQKVKKVVSTCK